MNYQAILRPTPRHSSVARALAIVGFAGAALLSIILFLHIREWVSQYTLIAQPLEPLSGKMVSGVFTLPPNKPYSLTIYADETSPRVACLLGGELNAEGRACGNSRSALDFTWSFIDLSGKSVASGGSHGGESFVTGERDHLIRGAKVAHISVNNSSSVRVEIEFRKSAAALERYHPEIAVEASHTDAELGYEFKMGMIVFALLSFGVINALIALISRRSR